ncbi:triosephosphate isomerase [Shimia gijangensis]|uniref:Triosephosphate isomerase n=1 Tax=Shimia gijangensis TaxID=1470563 RepID=A0A1M6NA78_9RHOB|nr:triose-phosphate isomerase [Shimia gijangensis]SHJ92476.1 triosephosphate isomerase [Shimia gijangensis]
MRRKLAAGNWKMNGLGTAQDELRAIAATPTRQTDLLICPPSTLLERAAIVASDTPLEIGGQDCHANPTGAHTGDISAEMLADCGASYVILGHSERRTDHNESNAQVAAKTLAAWTSGLTAVVCLGESLKERQSGQTLDVITAQLAGSLPDGATGENTVVAYEPIWAIGTGLVPEIAQIDEVHTILRAELVKRFGVMTGDAIRLLYGGSVKPDNAAEIFAVPNVDGALVGGASLKSHDFKAIIDALDAS